MKTSDRCCAVSANELPTVRPNDTNSAQRIHLAHSSGGKTLDRGRPFRAGGCSSRGIPEKEIHFYTIEASMSMKTQGLSYTLRENELPPVHPNDPNFAKTCCLFALFARSVQFLVVHGKHGERVSLRLSRKSRHSRESGNPLDRQWVPAFAGTTRGFSVDFKPRIHRWAAKISIMSGARNPVRGGLR